MFFERGYACPCFRFHFAFFWVGGEINKDIDREVDKIQKHGIRIVRTFNELQKKGEIT